MQMTPDARQKTARPPSLILKFLFWRDKNSHVFVVDAKPLILKFLGIIYLTIMNRPFQKRFRKLWTI